MAGRIADTLDRNYRYLVVAASIGLTTIGTGATFLIIVSLKPIALEFDWPRTIPSLAYSVQLVGMGVGGIVMGYWLDRFGMGTPAVLGAAMMGLGAVVASTMSNAWQLYLAYGVMVGFLGQGSLHGPLMANVLRWFDRGGGRAVGVVSSGQSLAGILWPPVFRYFNDAIGWRDTFFWYGVFALCAMLPLSLVLRREPPSAAERRRQFRATGMGAAPSAASIGAPVLGATALQAALCVAVVCCCVAMALPLVHLVAYVSDLGFSMLRAVELLSVLLAGAFVTRAFVMGQVIDRIGGLPALLLFSGLQTMGTVLFTAVDTLAGLYAVAIVFSLGLGGIIPCYAIAIREHLPAGQTGRRTGLVLLFGTIGMALGSWLGGSIYDLTGSYQLAFPIAAAVNGINLAIVVVLILRLRGGHVSVAG